MNRDNKKASDPMEKTVAQALDESVEQIDATTLSLLNQARHRAVESARPRWQFQRMSAAAAIVCTLVVSVILVQQIRAPSGVPAMSDADMNIFQEDIEMLEELEMMYWLAEQEGGRNA